jgi:hypothetical protein
VIAGKKRPIKSPILKEQRKLTYTKWPVIKPVQL